MARFGGVGVGRGVLGRERACVVLGAVALAALALVLDGKRARIEAVVVALVEVVGEFAADFQPLDGFDVHVQRVGRGEAFQRVFVQVDRVARVVDRLSRAVEGVVGVLGTQHGGQIGRGVPHRRTADIGLVVGFVAVGERRIDARREPFGEVVRHVDAGRRALESAVVYDALDVAVTQRHEIAAGLRAARHREVVVLIGCRAGDLVDPVGALAQRIGVVVGVVLNRAVAHLPVEIGHVVAVEGELRGVHHVEVAGQLREAHVGFERDPRFAHRGIAFLRGDDDDAVRAACAVDGRR